VLEDIPLPAYVRDGEIGTQSPKYGANIQLFQRSGMTRKKVIISKTEIASLVLNFGETKRVLETREDATKRVSGRYPKGVLSTPCSTQLGTTIHQMVQHG
jgi:hypothetical protein